MQRKVSLDRTGVTLTELLVVVSIIVLVTSALLPMLQPVLKGQKTREAARQLNAFFAGAQARAVERGKPVGVWIERAGHPEELVSLPSRLHTAHRLYLAEEPPSYAGDVVNVQVAINFDAPSPPPPDPNERPPLLLMHASFVPFGYGSAAAMLVHRGDLIRFNNRGPSFVVYRVVKPDGTLIQNPTDEAGAVWVDASPYLNRFRGAPAGRLQEAMTWLREKYDKKSFPFEVVRAPKKSVAAPLELPNNVGIDLMMSGYSLGLSPNDLTVADSQIQQHLLSKALSVRLFSDVFGAVDTLGLQRDVDPEFDILIMFSPRGGVDRICWVDAHGGLGAMIEGSDLSPLGTIGLLIARDDRIGQDQDANNAEDTLEDKNNLWLSIDVQSGRVVSAPNAGAVGWLSGLIPSSSDPETARAARIFRIWNSRELTVDGLNMGGR